MNNFKLLNHNLKLRLLLLFIQNLSSSTLFPFMFLLLSDLLNVRKASLFLICSLLIRLSFTVIGGLITDRLRNLKVIIVSSMSISFITLIIMSILIENPNNTGIVIFLIMYILNDIAYSINQPAMNTFALNNMSNHNLHIFSTYKYWITNSSMAIGILLGGYFFDYYKSALFLALALSMLFSLVIIQFFVVDGYYVSKLRKHINFKEYKIILTDKYFITLIFSFSLVASLEFVFSSYGALHLKENFAPFNFYYFKISGIKLFSLLIFFGSLIIFTTSIWISNKYRDTKSIIMSAILYITGYFILLNSINFYLLFFAMLLATVGEIIYSPIYESNKNKIIPPYARGIYSSLDNLSIPIAELISRLLLVLSTFLNSYDFIIIICLLCAIGFINMYRSIIKTNDRNYIQNEE